MNICLVAGGTGGHILPGLAIAKELKKRGHKVHFILKSDGLSQGFIEKEGFSSSSFYYSGFPRKFSFRLITFPFLSFMAYQSARRILKRENPDIVIGMGGYISVPVGICAVRMKIPLYLHEQNSCAGLANKLLSRWATVGTSFEKTKGLSPRTRKTVYTGLPIRPDLVPKDPMKSREELGLDTHSATLFVFGGSQGAHALNKLIQESVSLLTGEKLSWQIIHLTGNKDYKGIENFYKTLGGKFFIRAFCKDMATLYSAADFVVCRSGANTVMELSRMGKRALLVPYPYATDNHQTENARFIERAGAAQVVLEKDLTSAVFLQIIKNLPPLSELRQENEARLNNVSAQLMNGANNFVDMIESERII